MSTKQGKAVPLDREIPDGTAVISVVHPEGNPSGVVVEETIIKDNRRPDIGTNVGEALEQALQKNESKSSKPKKENKKMEETTNKTNTPATETKNQPKAETKQPQPKSEQKQTKEAAAPAEQSAAPAPAEKKEELANLVSELRSLKTELSSTPIRVEHYRSSENTGREAGHQFMVGLAAGAGVALGVTVVTTVAWLIQRKIAGSDNSSAE